MILKPLPKKQINNKKGLLCISSSKRPELLKKYILKVNECAYFNELLEWSVQTQTLFSLRNGMAASGEGLGGSKAMGTSTKHELRGQPFPWEKGRRRTKASRGLPELKPDQWMGQKGNKLKTLITFHLFVFPYLLLIFFYSFLSFSFSSFSFISFSFLPSFPEEPGGSRLGGKGSIFYSTFITQLDES